MKKALPYILIGIIVLGVLGLLFRGNKVTRSYDERISFRKRDKIPYGTFVAYEELKEIFPKAKITSEHKEPGMWDSLSLYSANQALIIISPQFTPDDTEMQRLISFVKSGNDVFVSAMKVSYYVEKYVKCDVYYPGGMTDPLAYWRKDDSLTVSLKFHPKNKTSIYSYPGKSYDYYFHGIDSSTTEVLGYNRKGRPNFIRVGAGKGNLFLHLAPMTFSNYFLLHKNNIGYYENALSFISRDKEKIAWDEYYLFNVNPDKNKNDGRKGWLKKLMSHREFAWALWIALLLLLLYVIMEMRRKQRPIPVINKPKNDTLDFVKTIGRLYHDKGDHANLARKMTAYFLEYVRNRYKLNTSQLDENFISNLQYKSGVPGDDILHLVNTIRKIESAGQISPTQLTEYHKQLESFYQKA